MGLVRTVALVILGLSGLTFIALFGRLPTFRYVDALLATGADRVGKHLLPFFTSQYGYTSLMG